MSAGSKQTCQKHGFSATRIARARFKLLFGGVYGVVHVLRLHFQSLDRRVYQVNAQRTPPRDMRRISPRTRTSSNNSPTICRRSERRAAGIESPRLARVALG